jgi:hypothetical protein
MLPVLDFTELNNLLGCQNLTLDEHVDVDG